MESAKTTLKELPAKKRKPARREAPSSQVGAQAVTPPQSVEPQAGVPRRMPSPVLEVSGAARAVQVKAMPLESPGYDRKAEACK